MVRTFIDRCSEVQLFVQRQYADKAMQAQALIASQGPDKLQYVVACVEADLLVHREVRKLWPYLLLIPDSEHTLYFCNMYGCSLENFGSTVDENISQVSNSLDIIDEKMGHVDVSGFWQQVREELIQQVCREAEILLAQSS